MAHTLTLYFSLLSGDVGCAVRFSAYLCFLLLLPDRMDTYMTVASTVGSQRRLSTSRWG